MSVPFRIDLADHVIGIAALYDETRVYYLDYLTDAFPSFHVKITPADIAFEREKSNREAIVEGCAPAAHSNEYLEGLAVYRHRYLNRQEPIREETLCKRFCRHPATP